MNQAKPAASLPKVGLGCRSVEETKNGDGNVEGSNSLVNVEVLGVAGPGREDALSSSAAGIGKGPDAVGNSLLELGVVDAEREQSGGDVKGERFGRARVDLSEKGRGDKGLGVRLQDVGDQLVGQLLGALGREDVGGGLAEG